MLVVSLVVLQNETTCLERGLRVYRHDRSCGHFQWEGLCSLEGSEVFVKSLKSTSSDIKCDPPPAMIIRSCRCGSEIGHDNSSVGGDPTRGFARIYYLQISLG